MRARAPASSANLGPGFDVLALALGLFVEVRVEPADRLIITTAGEGADLPADATHLAATVAAEVSGHDRLAIDVTSEIPVGRGLGSSAALAVAAAAAAGAKDPMAVAVRLDGHADNAAASALGGLIATSMVDGRPAVRRLSLDPHLAFVVLVPDVRLPTRRARAVLPASVSHRDAVFNLGRMGLVVAGLADHRHLVPAATDDRLHQPARAQLFPEAPALLAGLLEVGALASCWSGAGSSLLAITTLGAAGEVAAGAAGLMAEAGVAGQVLRLVADHRGVVTSP